MNAKPNIESKEVFGSSWVPKHFHGSQRVGSCQTDERVGVFEDFSEFLFDEVMVSPNAALERNQGLAFIPVVRILKEREKSLCPCSSRVGNRIESVQTNVRVRRVYDHIRELRKRWRCISPKYAENSSRVPGSGFFSIYQGFEFVRNSKFERDRSKETFNAPPRRGRFVRHPFQERWQGIGADFLQCLGCCMMGRVAVDRCVVLDFVVGYPVRKRAPFIFRFVVAGGYHDRCRNGNQRDRSNRNLPPAFHAHRVGMCFE